MRLVVLDYRSDTDSPYRLRVGPLALVNPLGEVGEQVGDGLEQIGPAVVAGERRARPFRLTLPIRGDHADLDDRARGLQLRRQARSLLDNTAWLQQALPMTWRADPDMDCWLLIGGGELIEDSRGLTFGDFKLELSDCYLVGRPGTHRAGRRIDLADRRTGVAPRDSWGALYTTDFATHPLPAAPAILPGDISGVLGIGGPPTPGPAGPVRAGRRLYRSFAATDGEVLSYAPDATVLPDALGRHALVDPPGAVRVWDTITPGRPTHTTAAADERPDVLYGWEPILGPLLQHDRPLAVDNGLVRCIWLGGQASLGLLIETWEDGVGYQPVVRVLHAIGPVEAFPVEVTPERAVLEFRAGGRWLRVLLQRGWPGPRLEVLDVAGDDAILELAPEPAATTVTATYEPPGWVARIDVDGTPALRAAQSHSAVTMSTTTSLISGGVASWTATRVLALQTAAGTGLLDADDLASLSLVDARPVPVLVER